MFRLWKWEILSCVLAIGMLGSMFGVLRRYDGQRIPDWGTVINLSTLIALMATLLRAMMGFVVAEVIGQAKWKYFAGGGRLEEDPPTRRLMDTSRFNDASQGSIGAVKLTPTISRDPATLLAVMVMVISLGTGSFVQQAIQTQSCQFTVDGAYASLPISRVITSMKAGDIDSFAAIDVSNIQAALSSALAPDNEEIGSPISVGCPTGNCTFQNSIGGLYSTLGVCSLCADTSSLITSTEWTRTVIENVYGESREALTADFSLPNGMSSQALLVFGDNTTTTPGQNRELLMSPELGLDWAGDLVSSDLKALNQWAFANFTVLTPNWLPTRSGNPEYVAVTCTVYPCLRSYNATVISGKLDEVLVSTVPAVPNVADTFGPNISMEAVQDALSGSDWGGKYLFLQAVQTPCLVNDTLWTKENTSSTLDLEHLYLVHADSEPGGAHHFRIENTTAPAECLYSLWAMTMEELRSIAATSFNGSCWILGSGNGSNVNVPFMVECGKTYWLASFLAENGTTAASITKRIEDFTDRFSNKLRMGLLSEAEAVSGQVHQATVCSRIQYSWLTFPAVLVSVTSGLLAWTMFQISRRQGREMVWKTSILPFLFYGERFVVQNGEDVSGHVTESARRDGPKEPLLDLDRMEAEARQQIVRFDVLN